MDADNIPTMPFTGIDVEEVGQCLGWILDIEKEYGLGCEVFDCVLAAHKRGATLAEGMSHAICEWDL